MLKHGAQERAAPSPALRDGVECGKQLAIDSDVSAGAIDHVEASERRRREQEETTFFGSLDGAAKFVKGDAIAGLLIIFLNLVVGMTMGTIHYGMPMAKAFEDAVTSSKKDSLMWAVYAWCLVQAGQRVAALEVLGRGLKEIPNDEKLKANQIALQNNERPKMKPYGQMWWAFHLEPVPMDHIPPGMRGQLQQRKGYRTFKQ